MKFTKVCQGASTLATVAVADNYFLRLRGLIGRSAEELGGLLISPCNQVHTCFMGEAIDIIYLDKACKVLRIDAEIPAWKMLKAERGSRKVLELPSGRAAELGIVSGSQLVLEQ